MAGLWKHFKDGSWGMYPIVIVSIFAISRPSLAAAARLRTALVSRFAHSLSCALSYARSFLSRRARWRLRSPNVPPERLAADELSTGGNFYKFTYLWCFFVPGSRKSHPNSIDGPWSHQSWSMPVRPRVRAQKRTRFGSPGPFTHGHSSSSPSPVPVLVLPVSHLAYGPSQEENGVHRSLLLKVLKLA